MCTNRRKGECANAIEFLNYVSTDTTDSNPFHVRNKNWMNRLERWTNGEWLKKCLPISPGKQGIKLDFFSPNDASFCGWIGDTLRQFRAVTTLSGCVFSYSFSFSFSVFKSTNADVRDTSHASHANTAFDRFSHQILWWTRLQRQIQAKVCTSWAQVSRKNEAVVFHLWPR